MRRWVSDSASRVVQRNGRRVEPISPDELIPQPHELVLRNGTPNPIAGWKALADSLLTNQSCVFHRNLEISSRYAWIYKFLPAILQVGRDGRVRVTPRPARPLSAAAGQRSHRLCGTSRTAWAAGKCC